MTYPNPPSGHQPPPLPPTAHVLPSEEPSPVVLRFFIGLLAGVCVSIIVWMFGWARYVTNGSGTAIYLVPATKFIVGLAFVIFARRWRSFGAGILVSVALGVLIFGGMLIHDAFNWPSSTPSQSTSATTSPSQSVTCKSLH